MTGRPAAKAGVPPAMEWTGETIGRFWRWQVTHPDHYFTNRFGGRIVVSSGAAALSAGMFLLALLDEESTYLALVPGMVVLGIGVGLFYSSVTTTAVTALDPSRSSLAGGIVYMCQIAGGAVGLGLNTAIVTSASSLADGIQLAFAIDGVLALAGLGVVLLVVPRKDGTTTHLPTRHAPHLRHRLRANA